MSDADRVEKEGALIPLELTHDNVRATMRELARDSMPKLLVESIRVEDVTKDGDGNVFITISGYKDGLYHDVGTERDPDEMG